MLELKAVACALLVWVSACGSYRQGQQHHAVQSSGGWVGARLQWRIPWSAKPGGQ